MNRKEKEKKVLEALDLRVGDVIEIVSGLAFYRETYKIIINPYADRYELECIKNRNLTIPLQAIISCDFHVIEYHQKTYGEYTCKEIHCANCPLNLLNCRMDRLETQTLYECLYDTIRDHDSRIYKTFCDELDKVVENENKILN